MTTRRISMVAAAVVRRGLAGVRAPAVDGPSHRRDPDPRPRPLVPRRATGTPPAGPPADGGGCLRRGETTQDLDIARTALREVGLDASFEPRLASTLSGGERRRVALATLLAQAVPLLILDEPTTHLDLHQQIALLDLLAGLSGHTVIMSLHDVNLAVRYCTHTLLIFGDGQCCAGPTATMLTADVTVANKPSRSREITSNSLPPLSP